MAILGRTEKYTLKLESLNLQTASKKVEMIKKTITQDELDKMSKDFETYPKLVIYQDLQGNWLTSGHVATDIATGTDYYIEGRE